MSRTRFLQLSTSLFSALLFVAILGFAPPAQGKTVTGKVLQRADGGKTTPVEHAVISLHGLNKEDTPELTQPAVMDQVDQTFEPHVLPVLAGQKVEFKNSEMTTHNVRLVRKESGKQLMNAMTLSGQKASYTFEELGVIAVRCDIHPSMLAYIVVMDNPFLSATTDENGEFSIDLPEGYQKGTLQIHSWAEDLGFSPGLDKKKTVELQADQASASVTLTYPSS